MANAIARKVQNSHIFFFRRNHIRESQKSLLIFTHSLPVERRYLKLRRKKRLEKKARHFLYKKEEGISKLYSISLIL